MNWEAFGSFLGGMILSLLAVLADHLSKPSPLKSMVKSLSDHSLVTVDDVDHSVQEFLAGSGIPEEFSDWVGDMVGKLVVEVPTFFSKPKEQRDGIIASLFSKEKMKFIKSVLPILPAWIAEQKWASKRFVQRLLAVSNLVEKVQSNGVNSG